MADKTALELAEQIQQLNNEIGARTQKMFDNYGDALEIIGKYSIMLDRMLNFESISISEIATRIEELAAFSKKANNDAHRYHFPAPAGKQ